MFNEVTGQEALPEKPDLCHKCGKCCRSATTYHTYETLQQMVKDGHKEATDFLEVFEPFPSIEEARKAVPDQVDQVLQQIEGRQDMRVEDVTFYHCRYVSEEGLCTIYERRPNCCRVAPQHGWDMMPPGCGFEGWQFLQREKHKSDIRRLKEVQYRMEILSDDGVTTPSGTMTLDELRSVVSEAIQPWLRYGSDLW